MAGWGLRPRRERKGAGIFIHAIARVALVMGDGVVAFVWSLHAVANSSGEASELSLTRCSDNGCTYRERVVLVDRTAQALPSWAELPSSGSQERVATAAPSRGVVNDA